MGELSATDFLLDALPSGVRSAIATTRVFKELEKRYSKDQPRDADGRFGSGAGEPTGPVSGADFTVEDGSKYSGVVDTVIRAQTEKNANWGLHVTGPSAKNEYQMAAMNKAAVARDIAARMGPQYDSQLMASQVGVGDYPAPPIPAAQLLGHDSVWSRADDGAMTYIGSQDSKFGQHYLDPNRQATSALDAGVIMRGDDPRVAQSLREEGVSTLVSQWAQTSNGTNASSLAIQESAVKEFGLTGTAPWESQEHWYPNANNPNETPPAPLDQQVQTDLDRNGAMYQGFLRAQYDNTQAFFAAHNITEVPVFRGMDISATDTPAWADPERNDVDEDGDHWTADVPLRPLNSFSLSPATATNFTSPSGDTNPYIISGTVPVTQILSTAVTGIGCTGESEIVVLGGTNKWDVN